jgi:hypothetical protein
MVRAIKVQNIKCLAICSDGFEEELADQIWGHKNLLGLQRLLNRLSHFSDRFPDDCSVITIERLEGGDDDGNK